MASRMIIVVGDITNSGGRVITGSPQTDIDGKPIARVGDRATCPKCKGMFPIVSGDATFLVDGQPVARHGDYLACCCRLVSVRQFRVFLDEDTSDDPTADAAMFRARVSEAAAGAVAYDEAFALVSEFTGKPLANRRYRVIRKSGAVEEGVTDSEGLTHLVTSELPELLHVELGEEEIA